MSRINRSSSERSDMSLSGPSVTPSVAQSVQESRQSTRSAMSSALAQLSLRSRKPGSRQSQQPRSNAPSERTVISREPVDTASVLSDRSVATGRSNASVLGGASQSSQARSQAPSGRTAISRGEADTVSVLSDASAATGRSNASNHSTRSSTALHASAASLGLGSHRDELGRTGRGSSQASGGTYAEWKAMQENRRRTETSGSESPSPSLQSSSSSGRRFKPGSLASRVLDTASSRLSTALGHRPAFTVTGDPSKIPTTPRRESPYEPDLSNPAVALAAHQWDPVAYPSAEPTESRVASLRMP
ncbi:UNVERIFIED_ORG: hypothetical protein ABIC62_003384 [Burkholderia sp. 1595]|uniref:Uncharacterized protein n=1 Tax=Paraburkholderia terricola TaxID=169427 RepID=A0ABU1LRB8_9BURK|nr:hypothetical protein [Paraburkholderia terricola]MDR6482024.1 hypothetical protein [Paraburkholderia terricola]